MITPSRRTLSKQLNGVERWLPLIKAAATRSGFDAALLLAIGSRESNLNAYYQGHSGDGGNGFSMWQIDKRSYPAFVASGDWKDVGKAVNKAADVLNEKLNEVKALTAGRALPSDVNLHMAIAAYNCGSSAAVRGWKAYGDPDRGTTGHDYSADVLRRQAVFSDLLAEMEPVTPAQPTNVEVPTDLPGDVKVPAVTDKPEETPSVQSIVTGHSDTLKGVAARSGLKLARWVGMIWMSTWGKAFLILITLVIVTEVVYNIVLYWPKIKEWLPKAKDFILKLL